MVRRRILDPVDQSLDHEIDMLIGSERAGRHCVRELVEERLACAGDRGMERWISYRLPVDHLRGGLNALAEFVMLRDQSLDGRLRRNQVSQDVAAVSVQVVDRGPDMLQLLVIETPAQVKRQLRLPRDSSETSTSSASIRTLITS